ncbi:MAG: hypothetical protein KU37_07390 [Sulfuricurvum sp. PC08-66]|nr:MAG: hypothetical protein KU37_07390 [Sulfuricurvum sp. PC08-66]
MSHTLDRDLILQAHKERYACKRFDASRTVAPKDIEYLLEIARYSPSSIGLEPWKFVVVTSPDMKATLKPLCWNQPQLTDASVIIVILTRTQKSLLDEGYLDAHFNARALAPQWYKGFVEKMSDPLAWTKRQAYIAMANIMSSAKMIGIDSCPIEGFDSSTAVTAALGFDTTLFDTAVIVALGYGLGEHKPKARLDADDVIVRI